MEEKVVESWANHVDFPMKKEEIEHEEPTVSNPVETANEEKN